MGINYKAVTTQQLTLMTLAALTLFLLVWLVSPYDTYLASMTQDRRNDLFQLSAQVAATLLGFTIAVLTILISVPGARRFGLFAKSKWYGNILTLFLGGAAWSLVWTIVSIQEVMADAVELSKLAFILFAGSALLTMYHMVASLLSLLVVMDIVVSDRRQP